MTPAVLAIRTRAVNAWLWGITHSSHTWAVLFPQAPDGLATRPLSARAHATLLLMGHLGGDGPRGALTVHLAMWTPWRRRFLLATIADTVPCS